MLLKCKLCNSADIKIFKKYKFSKYFYCNNCTTLFLQTNKNKTYYNLYYKNCFNIKNNPKNDKRVNKISKEIIYLSKQFNSKINNVLDIGFGKGIFLIEAAKHFNNIEGIEISDNLYKKFHNHKQIKAYHISIDNFIKYQNKKYDFIILSHIVEHLPNIKNVLIQVCNLLNKNGILYIETPNLDSYLFKFELKSYTFLSPKEHLYIFSQSSMTQIFKYIKDMKLIKLKTYSFPEHFSGIIKCLLNKHSRNHNKFKKIRMNISQRNKMKNKLKYLIFDKIICNIFTFLLNINNKGSISCYFYTKHDKYL